MYKVFCLALGCSILFFLGCGQQNQSSSATSCTPNVNDTGLQLLVVNLGSNTYSFTLCAPSNPASVYTVYGATDIASLQTGSINVNASWRQMSITGTNSTGKSFQVTFHGSDNAFAIYQDVSNGSGGYNLDSTKPMVSPRALRVF